MGRRKEFTGTVVSDKMQKTAIVRVTLITKHPKYGRVVKHYNKFKVHDEKKVAKVGDTVRIQETRPLSKDKRFRIVEVIKKVELPEIELKEEVK
ncbi:30S ribosomal protein S17 [bacterium]|nr:MAG: 30S ribosomal protein S17 [bacterium]